MRRVAFGFLAVCLAAVFALPAEGAPKDLTDTLQKFLFEAMPYTAMSCDEKQTSIITFLTPEGPVITRVVPATFNYFYKVWVEQKGEILYFVVENKTAVTYQIDEGTFRERLRSEAPQYAKFGNTYGQSDCKPAPIPGPADNTDPQITKTNEEPNGAAKSLAIYMDDAKEVEAGACDGGKTSFSFFENNDYLTIRIEPGQTNIRLFVVMKSGGARVAFFVTEPTGAVETTSSIPESEFLKRLEQESPNYFAAWNHEKSDCSRSKK